MPGFPTPDTSHPVPLPDGSVHAGTVFLNAVIDHPRIEAGDYSYASAFQPPEDWAAHLAPYLYDFSPERLVIGKFCQIADGVRFITASANHRYDGFSSYPFAIFDGGGMERPSLPSGPFADTVIGHDVWIGQGAPHFGRAVAASCCQSLLGRCGAAVRRTAHPSSWNRCLRFLHHQSVNNRRIPWGALKK